MFFIILYTIVYVVIFLVNILPLLRKQNKKKEFIIVTVLVSISYIGQILVLAGVSIPAPNQVFGKVFKILKLK